MHRGLFRRSGSLQHLMSELCHCEQNYNLKKMQAVTFSGYIQRFSVACRV